MREIKFRAWDTLQGGKFEYWNPKTDKCDGIFWTMIKHKSFKTPQQYTCLRDKNNKEIYEGDMVKYKWNGKYILMEIIFKDGEFIAHPFNSVAWDIRINGSNKVFEVVGNIHQNIELLKP